MTDDKSDKPASAAVGGRQEGYWLHDAAGPQRYVKAVLPDATELRGILLEKLGAGADRIELEVSERGLRLGGRAPKEVAQRAVSWAVQNGFDPVEDDLEREPSTE